MVLLCSFLYVFKEIGPERLSDPCGCLVRERPPHTPLTPELGFSALPLLSHFGVLMEKLQLASEPSVLQALGPIPGAWLPPERSRTARRQAGGGGAESGALMVNEDCRSHGLRRSWRWLDV